MANTRLDAWTIPYTEPNDHDSTRYVTMCRLRDADGVTGWGEAVTIHREAAQATTAMLRGWAALLDDVEPVPAAVRQAVEERAWWYGTGGGLSAFAAAALDTAAWDLLARRAGLALTEVLGGAVHASLPTVVVTHATLADVDAQAAVFARWTRETGSSGVKVGFGKAGDAHLGFEHERDVTFIASLRSALGSAPRIMIDCSPRLRWTAPEAIARVRAFEEYGLHWIEEPLGADDPHGYRRLRDATSTLIAYGERAWTVPEMARLLETGTLDVLGIDAGRAGGVSGFVEGARLAALQHRQANAHAFAGPISYAAGLASSLVSPACRQFEIAPLRNSLIEQLTPGLSRPADGRVTALPGPGLGLEIDEDLVIALAQP